MRAQGPVIRGLIRSNQDPETRRPAEWAGPVSPASGGNSVDVAVLTFLRKPDSRQASRLQRVVVLCLKSSARGRSRNGDLCSQIKSSKPSPRPHASRAGRARPQALARPCRRLHRRRRRGGRQRGTWKPVEPLWPVSRWLGLRSRRRPPAGFLDVMFAGFLHGAHNCSEWLDEQASPPPPALSRRALRGPSTPRMMSTASQSNT